MKTLRSVLVLLALLVSANIVAKPKIRIIATGGTIAGVSESATSSAYSAGQVGVQTLIDAVPQMLYLADISGEQLVNIGSKLPDKHIQTDCRHQLMVPFQMDIKDRAQFYATPV